MNKPTHIKKLQLLETQETSQQPKQKAAWQRPHVQLLRVSLDTTNRNASNSDGLLNTGTV